MVIFWLNCLVKAVHLARVPSMYSYELSISRCKSFHPIVIWKTISIAQFERPHSLGHH
jgi:hypothetical protein